eukprot:g9672.t1
MASHGRLGSYIRTLNAGDTFGEIALSTDPKDKAGKRRTASIVADKKFNHENDPTYFPQVSFMTLQRSMYQRLIKVQNDSSDIGTKVRVLMDSYILKKKVKPSDPSWRLNKINVTVVLKYPFDICGCLPMVKDIPYYFKDVRALTNLTAVKINVVDFRRFIQESGEMEDITCKVGSSSNEKSLVQSLNEIQNRKSPQEYAQKTVNFINKGTERFDEFRIQRVRAAIDSDGLVTPCTKEMQKLLVTCGRCGKKGHSFGELNLFGKHLCPIMNIQMANSNTTKTSKKVATKKGISRLEQNNWRRRSPGAPSYRRPTTSKEKKHWAGKQGTVERFEYFLNKSASRKLPICSRKTRPQTVGGKGRSISKISTTPISGKHNGNGKRPSTASDMVIHKTRNNRLLRQPARPPINIHVRHNRRSSLKSSPRSMRAAKLFHVVHEHQEENDDFIMDYLLRRQCVQYIMPRHVESMHLRDDIHHDDVHDDTQFGNGGVIDIDEW